MACISGTMRDHTHHDKRKAGTIIDFTPNFDRDDGNRNEWKSWMDQTNKDEIDRFPKGTVVNEIIVTTTDTIRYGYMQELFVIRTIIRIFSIFWINISLKVIFS